MTTLGQVQDTFKQLQKWVALGGLALLLSTAIIMQRAHRATQYEPLTQTESYTRAFVNKPLAIQKGKDRVSAALASPASVNVFAEQSPAAFAEQKTIRTAEMSVVVQHPAETADEISALAEKLGGYLVSAEGGGQDAIRGALTIRVPAARFEEARAAIRKLGLRVESERVGAEDVTQRYVDQDASLRNLRAEEAQYLTILKQASTVKDMLAVSERLGNVRGQIEQQQAEFNALSRQVETVAITISLRKEVETQVFGLNWRPLYQLKLALRDGLDSVGNYAAAMITILFYLPAAALWVGTILAVIFMGWKLVRWIGHRWLGWTQDPEPAK